MPLLILIGVLFQRSLQGYQFCSAVCAGKYLHGYWEWITKSFDFLVGFLMCSIVGLSLSHLISGCRGFDLLILFSFTVSWLMMPKRKHNGSNLIKRESKTSNITSENKRRKETNGKSSENDVTSHLDFSSPENFFSSFITPCSATDFLEEYWEKKPLHLSNRDGLICGDEIFSKKVLENLVEEDNIEFIRDVCTSCYKNGVRKNLDGHGRLKPAQLKKLIEKQNATIQLHQPQRFKVSCEGTILLSSKYFVNVVKHPLTITMNENCSVSVTHQ